VVEDIGALINLTGTLLLLLVGFFVGEIIERRHYKSIRQRERNTSRLPAVTTESLPTPAGWEHDRAGLVTGHVVISVDYFKRFVAALRGFFGGRISSYESLLDRARREAILRMKKAAMEGGYHAVVNVRLETATIARSGSGRRKSTAGVEILAFGTGVRMRKLAV